MTRTQTWALDGSLLGNRQWTYARSSVGPTYRVVCSFPFNPTGLPLFAVTGALGTSLLFLAIDALLWPFSFLNYRTVSVLADGDMPIPGWGKCVFRQRRVPVAGVHELVLSLMNEVEGGSLPRSSRA